MKLLKQNQAEMTEESLKNKIDNAEVIYLNENTS